MKGDSHCQQSESPQPNTTPLRHYRQLDRHTQSPSPHTCCKQTQILSLTLSLTHKHTQMHSVCLPHIISLAHRGEMSQPCCMKAPSENQRELKMPNSLGGWSVGPSSVAPSSGSSACHSYGLKRLTWDGRKVVRKQPRANQMYQNNTWNIWLKVLHNHTNVFNYWNNICICSINVQGV